MLTSFLTRSLLISSLLLAAVAAPSAQAWSYVPSGPRMDKSFGERGHAWISPKGHGAHQEIDAVFPAADGSVYALIAGGPLKKQGSYLPIVRRTHWYLLHFLKSGRVDRSFGDHGSIRKLPWPSTGSPDVKIDAKGRLLLTGWTRGTKGSKTSKIFFVRYSARGKHDKKYGAAGRVSLDAPYPSMGALTASAADGGEWIAISDSKGWNKLVRLDNDGMLAAAPIATAGAGRCINSRIDDLVAMSDGSVIVGCPNVKTGATTEEDSGLLVRLQLDGSLKSDWATGGVFTVNADPPGSKPFAEGAAHGAGSFRELPGGGMALAIYASKFGGFVGWLARLTPAGVFDTTYATVGSLVFADQPMYGYEDNAFEWSAPYPQADGSWILSDYWGDDDGNVGMSKVSPTGVYSNIFGDDRSVVIPGEMNGPPPIPTADGKSAYSFMNVRMGSDKHPRLRALIYRVRLGS